MKNKQIEQQTNGKRLLRKIKITIHIYFSSATGAKIPPDFPIRVTIKNIYIKDGKASIRAKPRSITRLQASEKKQNKSFFKEIAKDVDGGSAYRCRRERRG